jgi:diguanylate cyclase (GGDEF)-like protein/PAS domain S-box-containing protein
MTDENGQKVGFRGIIRDVSDYKLMEKALRESEERFRLISRSAHDGILMMDHEGKISYWNEAAIRIFGYSQNEALGRDLHGLLVPEKYLDAFNKGFKKFAQTGTGSAIGNTLELTAFRKDESEFPMELSLSAVEFEGLWHSIGIIRDISERKQAEEELKRLSYLDGLTGVANRRRFDEALGLEWRRMTRDAEPLSLIMCDIDFFKAYNDTYGHQGGDDSLRQVANTLNSVLGRPGDLVARYGGEEFAVIMPGTDSQGAKILAEKMRVCVESLGITHTNSKVCEVLTISLGVATTIPTSGSLPDELVSAADQALYEAKKEGRNRVNLDE